MVVKRSDILSHEYHAYYQSYIEQSLPESTIIEVLEDSLFHSQTFINSINISLDYRYAADKWTLGQLIQHCIDTERVFAYRALRFMRGDKTALSGFDQDIFATATSHHAFAKAELLHALQTTRAATIQLYKEVTDAVVLSNLGTASGNLMSARAIPYIIAGHFKHHEHIAKERYLNIFA